MTWGVEFEIVIKMHVLLGYQGLRWASTIPFLLSPMGYQATGPSSQVGLLAGNAGINDRGNPLPMGFW